MPEINAPPVKTPVDPAAPSVSVVVPVHNGGPGLERCLAAVTASSYPLYEIILVDDGSTDDVIVQAAGRHGARVIRLDQRGGPAIARNRGAGEAGGDLLMFIDADVLVHANAIAIAVAALQRDPALSAVFGSYDDQPGYADFLSQYRNLYHHWVHQNGDEEASTFWAGCGAIRRDIFNEMGGFSVDYGRPSIEDIELGSRLRKSGHRVRLEKTMLATHLKQWTFWNLLKTDVFYRAVPWMSLVLLDRAASRDLNLNLRSRVAAVLAGLAGLACIILLFTGHIAAIWPATAALLAAPLGTVFSASAIWRKADTLLSAALVVLAAMSAFMLAPDVWAVLPLGLIGALVWLQRAFFCFLARRRGGAFAIAAVPMQVLFFLGCAVSVPLALIKHYRLKQAEPVR